MRPLVYGMRLPPKPARSEALRRVATGRKNGGDAQKKTSFGPPPAAFSHGTRDTQKS